MKIARLIAVVLVVVSLVAIAVSVVWTTWIDPPTDSVGDALARMAISIEDVAAHLHTVENHPEDATEGASVRVEKNALPYCTETGCETATGTHGVRRAPWRRVCANLGVAEEP